MIQLTHASLCSGIGGIDLAAHWAGFTTTVFCERDTYCQKILARHFPGVPIHDDVTTFNGLRCRGVTLLSAGFPCQPFSVAGKRAGSGDERHLWPEIKRVVREARPRWFLGENVPGLLSIERGRVFGDIIDDLAGLGYRVGWGVWRAWDTGACHYRKRVFIIAYTESQQSGRLLIPRVQTNFSPSDQELTDAGRMGFQGNLEQERGNGAQDQGRLQISERSAGTPPLGHTSGVGRCHKARAGRKGGQEPQGAHRGPDCHYFSLPDRDWQSWGIEPVLCGGDDGLSARLDPPSQLKALGNAVVPHQVLPLLLEIAAYEQAAAASVREAA